MMDMITVLIVLICVNICACVYKSIYSQNIKLYILKGIVYCVSIKAVESGGAIVDFPQRVLVWIELIHGKTAGRHLAHS